MRVFISILLYLFPLAYAAEGAEISFENTDVLLSKAIKGLRGVC